MGQALTEGEKKLLRRLASVAKERALSAWQKFEVFRQEKAGALSKSVADTRGELAWKTAEGKRNAEARLVAQGRQDPDLKDGFVGTPGRVTICYSHLRIILLKALRKREIWKLGVPQVFS